MQRRTACGLEQGHFNIFRFRDEFIEERRFPGLLLRFGLKSGASGQTLVKTARINLKSGEIGVAGSAQAPETARVASARLPNPGIVVKPHS